MIDQALILPRQLFVDFGHILLAGSQCQPTLRRSPLTIILYVLAQHIDPPVNDGKRTADSQRTAELFRFRVKFQGIIWGRGSGR